MCGYSIVESSWLLSSASFGMPKSINFPDLKKIKGHLVFYISPPLATGPNPSNPEGLPFLRIAQGGPLFNGDCVEGSFSLCEERALAGD